jgi:hypothetical protein
MLIPALLAAFLMMGTQGISVAVDQSGTVSGVLKDSAGRPAPGVRVGAIAVPESDAEISSATAMVSLAATDEAGRYRLENVPPGRYYIAAGRLDFPTYFPGTTALARGTVISITPKAVVDGIDFAMLDSSARVAGPELPGNAGLTFAVPVQVKVDGGGKLPVFSPNGFMTIRMTNTSNGVRSEIPINVATIPVPNPTAEFRITIENLPPGYVVKSISAGPTDIKAATLRLSALTFSPGPVPSAPMTATAALSITLAMGPAPPAAASGVRVSGRAGDAKRRSIYLSGKPGIFYADGTFEFRGVAAGRHTLATLDNPESRRPLGASIVVGERDVEGVELHEVALLPPDLAAGPIAKSAQPAGASVRLAALRVRVVNDETGEPAGPGSVYILGRFGTSFDLPSDGRFEFPQLLPGTYSFEVQAFRHETVTRIVSVGEEDVDLEVAVRRIE